MPHGVMLSIPIFTGALMRFPLELLAMLVLLRFMQIRRIRTWAERGGRARTALPGRGAEPQRAAPR